MKHYKSTIKPKRKPRRRKKSLKKSVCYVIKTSDYPFLFLGYSFPLILSSSLIFMTSDFFETFLVFDKNSFKSFQSIQNIFLATMREHQTFKVEICQNLKWTLYQVLLKMFPFTQYQPFPHTHTQVHTQNHTHQHTHRVKLDTIARVCLLVRPSVANISFLIFLFPAVYFPYFLSSCSKTIWTWKCLFLTESCYGTFLDLLWL